MIITVITVVMHIIRIDRDMKDVYLDVISEDLLKIVFYNCKILKKDSTGQNIIMRACYKKSILDAYQNDFLNILRSLCIVDEVIIHIEHKIFAYSDRFVVCYLMKVQNHNEFPLIPFLDSLRALFIIEFKLQGDGTICKVIDIKIDHNLLINADDIHAYVSNCKEDNEDNEDNEDSQYEFEDFSYKQIQELYKRQQKHFFKSEYDMQKDIVVNFLNMLLNDCVRYAYIKQICKYYSKKDVKMKLRVSEVKKNKV